MSERLVQTAVILGVLVMAVATLLAPMISGTVDKSVERVAINQGESVQLTDLLTVHAIDIRDNQGDATIRYRNERTFERVDVTLNETDPPETKAVTLSNETINATLISIDNNNTAVVESEFNSTFGWQDGPNTFMNNFGIVLTILAGIIIFGLVKVVLL